MTARLLALGALAVMVALGVTFGGVVALAWLTTRPRWALLSGLIVLGIGGVWLGLR